MNDIPLWLPSKSERYSCRNIWKAIRVKQPKVDWSRQIWFSCVIPRHAFFLRLAAQDSLSTGDRLLKWGVSGEVKCLFCRSIIECRDHLYFECGFNKRIWREAMQMCSLISFPTAWDEVLSKWMSDWRGKSLKVVVRKLDWGSTVYNIWR